MIPSILNAARSPWVSDSWSALAGEVDDRIFLVGIIRLEPVSIPDGHLLNSENSG